MNEYPRATLVYGFWGQNIGNAFFNVGGHQALVEALGPNSVSLIQDQPGYRTFHDQMSGNPANAFPAIASLDTDLVVLQGPLLTTSFPALWGETLRVFERRKIKYALLGAAFFKFNPREIRASVAFLKEWPPVAISTRDAETFRILKEHGIESHNGIDSAFFVPDAAPVAKFGDDSRPIIVGFDRVPEPQILVSKRPMAPHEAGKNEDVFNALGATWRLQHNRTAQRIAAAGKWQAYFGQLINRHAGPTEILGSPVVRPEHRSNPHMTFKIYQRPGAVVSDEPFTYFSLYKSSRLTLSDRVHACALTLAYGNPAMLFSPTPRAALLDRVGAGRIRERPCTINMDYLAEQKQDVVGFLRDRLT